jgi:type IV pilus assembly protein PilN
MIRINLLPTRRKPPKKVTELQKQSIIAVLVLLAVGAVMAFVWMSLNARIAERQQRKAAAEARVREQDNMLKEVKNVEAERKKVIDKIGIIEQLKKNQQGPVRMLDEISKALPTGVNLESLAESGGNINLAGSAFTNEDVVRFVDNLKTSSFLADVYLLESVQASDQGYEIYKYRMQLRYKGM